MGRTIDYAFKSLVLREYEDLIHYVRKCKRYDYVKAQAVNNGLILKMPKSDKELKPLSDLRMDYADIGQSRLIQECIKINSASMKRTKRLKDRIETIISQNESTFLTLTFTDKVLSDTTAQTRRRYVARFLKSCNAPYVANVDYGKENHREHYHAVIGSQKIRLGEWCYGGNKALKIIVKNTNALSKYVCKLSNHAIKETTKRSTLLYSR